MIFNRQLLFVMIASLSILGSCVKEKKKVSEQDLMIEQDSVFQDKTFYKIPSPVELFMFMQENGAVFDKKLVNTPENKGRYETSKSKSVNFGIYAADMGYCVVFGQFQETFGYFTTTKSLGTELELTQGFGEEMAKRVQENLYNLDSLTSITGNSYWEACTFLEKQNKLDLLTLILAGSWVESLYIAMGSVKKFKADDPIVVRIAEQGMLLDNLIEFIETKTPDSRSDIKEKLVSLRDTFDQLDMNDENTTITENQFVQIKQQVISIRNQFIQ